MKQIKQTLLLLLALWGATQGVVAQITDYAAFDDKFNFYVISDCGRNGYFNQKEVARTMGDMADGVDPEFVIAAGDVHHFNGVQSTTDPLWLTNYELIYDHPDLMLDWYPVLGNHEYRGNTQAVLDYSRISRRWVMPARYYTKTFLSEEDGATLRVVWIDTPPLLDKYRADYEKYPDASLQNMQTQLDWLEAILAAAKEDWVIVVGHHPIYAQTSKNSSERTNMQERVDTLLRRHGVDMYICGHIHNFQHIRVEGSNIDYIVNTAGAQTRKVTPTDGTQFCDPAAGFGIGTVTKTELIYRMVDLDGNLLHTVTRRK